MIALPKDVPLPEGHFMTIWVIYDHPTDCPDGFVLRPQFVVRGQSNDVVASDIAWYANTIDELRSILPGGLVALGDPNPKIAETWM